MKCTMELGESRIIQIMIHSTEEEYFEIISARYEIRKKYTDEHIASGDADIINHVLRTLITPPEAGEYLLKYTYQIGAETLIDVVEVRVK